MDYSWINDQLMWKPSPFKTTPMDQSFSHWTEFSIQWGQTNVHEHMPQDLILQWIESARIPLLEELDLMTFDGALPGIILGNIQLELFGPLSYPDSVKIGTRVKEILQDRFVLETVLISHHHQALTGHHLATLVLYDYALGTKIDIPLSIRQQLELLVVSHKAE